jgi:predicted RNase H-like HicB family nuclease
MKNVTLVYAYDLTGGWFTSVKELPGCHTQVKALKQARQRLPMVREK